jgi:AraC-like DNA-binding protein
MAGARCYAARRAVPRPIDIPGTISMLQVQPLVLALPQLGLDPERVFGQLGLSLKDIADPNGRIAAGIEFDIWDAVQAAYGQPCVGLHIADLVKAGALGAYGYLLRNSTTLRAAIDHANRYERVVDDLSRVSLIEDGATAMLRLWRVGDYPHPPQGIECTFAVIVKLIADELPSPAFAREVRFAHRMTGPLEERTKRFRCPVRFEQPHHEIEIDAALLDLPVRSADPHLGEVLEDHVRIMLAALPTEDPLILRARTALAESLAGGVASLEALADTLHMSERTLRRRLDEHGTSYKQLLDELRQQLARYYVARTDQSLEQVASRLGFTEPSTFYRAFKRWEGTTPAAYRGRGLVPTPSPGPLRPRKPSP